jgi:lipopolysaccharide export LptBFGC system permease protein LptF
MFGTLDRYIIKLFFKNYVLGMSVFISLYVVLHLFINLDEFTEGGMSVWQVLANIFDYYVYNLFWYFSQLSGVITLFAGAVTLAQMQRRNELSAMLASGVSLYRVAAPVVICGMIVGGLWIVDQEVVLPKAAAKLARPADDVHGNRVYGVWFMPDKGNTLVSGIKFQAKTQQLYRMIVFTRDEDNLVQEIMFADRGVWNASEGAWTLQRGSAFRSTGMGQAWDSLDTLHVRSVNRYPEQGESELSPDNILMRQQSHWTQFLSTRQLIELERKNVLSASQIAPVRHGRVTMPIGNMLLLLLGIPFFLNREPSSTLKSAAKCLLACGGCFILSFISQNIIEVKSLPALPAWLPLMIFGPVAVIYLDRVRT